MLAERDLVTELTARFGARITILYGSYARYSADATGDVDVVCFCGPSARHPVTFRWRTLLVDAWIHPLDDLREVGEFRKVHDGRVIQDEGGKGEALLSAVGAKLRELRPRLDLPHDRHLRAWVWKMFDRAAGSDLRADHRRHWLLHDLPEIWCDLNQRHFVGPQAAFDQILQFSPELYEVLVLAMRPDASLEDIERFVKLVVGPRVDSS